MRSMKRKSSTISRIFPSQPTQRRPFCKTTVALAPPIVTTRNEDAAERMSDLEWNPLFLPSSSVVSGLRWPCRDRAVSSALPFRPCNLWSAIFAPHLGQLCQRRPADEKHPHPTFITRKTLERVLLFLRGDKTVSEIPDRFGIDYTPFTLDIFLFSQGHVREFHDSFDGVDVTSRSTRSGE